MIEQQIPRAGVAASVRAHGVRARDAMEGSRRASGGDPLAPLARVVDAFADGERPAVFDRARFDPIGSDLAANADGIARRDEAFRIRPTAAICEMADA
jgi:hypothetical protein